MEKVSANGLISIAKVYTISDDVATSCVNEIGGTRVIVVHGGEGLKWFVGVETDV